MDGVSGTVQVKISLWDEANQKQTNKHKNQKQLMQLASKGRRGGRVKYLTASMSLCKKGAKVMNRVKEQQIRRPSGRSRQRTLGGSGVSNGPGVRRTSSGLGRTMKAKGRTWLSSWGSYELWRMWLFVTRCGSLSVGWAKNKSSRSDTVEEGRCWGKLWKWGVTTLLVWGD